MANLVTMYEKLYVKGVRVNMDSRDTKEFYEKRQSGNSSYKPQDSRLLSALCLLLVATMFGVMMYEIVTEMYL